MNKRKPTKPTIYFALFKSEQHLHDRIKSIQYGGASLAEFYVWVEETRSEIEKEYNTTEVVMNMKYITEN